MQQDLNRLRSKLKNEQKVGVDRNGTLSTSDPGNDGSRPSANGNTTVEPKRFFHGTV